MTKPVAMGADMARKGGTRAGYIDAAIDASLQLFTITYLAFFSAAVLLLTCDHVGLVDLAAFDPSAWDSVITAAVGSGVLAFCEIFRDLLSFHRKKRLLARWKAAAAAGLDGVGPAVVRSHLRLFSRARTCGPMKPLRRSLP
jgi:hypothetical protein